MQSYNRLILTGFLGADPETKDFNGTKACNFSISVSKKLKDKEETFWFKIVSWSKLADICEKYLKKGSRVLVEGELRESKYTDKQGVEKKVNFLSATNVQFLSASNKKQESNTKESSDELPF